MVHCWELLPLKKTQNTERKKNEKIHMRVREKETNFLSSSSMYRDSREMLHTHKM